MPVAESQLELRGSDGEDAHGPRNPFQLVFASVPQDDFGSGDELAKPADTTTSPGFAGVISFVA